jgi:putative DNA primase/helicase
VTAAPHFHDDRDDLHAALTARLESLAEALLGAPNPAVSSKREWRWGTKGSLAVVMRGPKRGAWISREDDSKGYAFDLIMRVQRCGFAEAKAWARTWVGGAAPSRTPRPTEAARLAARQQAEAAEQAERARAIRTAQGMAHAAVPIASTPAESYLLAARCVPCPAGGWPDAIRYHAATRSLLAVATTVSGAVQAVQRVHVTPAGAKVSAEELAARKIPAVKVTNGVQQGALVRLPARPDAHPALAGALLLAEGPENGLSVWAATGLETWLVFGVGQFQHVELPPGRRVILCRDDDREHSPADKAVRKAVTAWRKAGADVSMATPWRERRGDKSDFNDLLLAAGSAGVLARILPHAPTPAPQPIKRVSIAEARRQVDEAMRRCFDAVRAFDPDMAKAEGKPLPILGIRKGVGIGGSYFARHYAVELIAELRAAGSRRNVVFAVPTHKLGAEQAAILEALPAFKAAGLRVAVWRGRKALDPGAPGYADPSVPDADKIKMCRNPEPVLEAEAHGLGAQETACRRTVTNAAGERIVHECQFHANCKYQEATRQKADLWIVPHELLFTSTPAAIGDIAAVVGDESAWQDGLEGIEGRGDRLPLDALRGHDMRPGESRDPSWLTLADLRRRALDALEPMSDGLIIREAFDGFTPQEATEARALALGRLVRPEIVPGMSRQLRAELLKLAAGNRNLLREARWWRALAELLADGGPAASGWASLETIETPDGPQRVIRLRGRRPVRTGWQAPTILVDALLNLDLVRPFWPQVDLVADVQADAPHQHIRQVVDCSFAKSRLEPLDKDAAAANPTEARRRIKNLRHARAIICREARRHTGGKVLVVCQKGVREALAALGRLPRNIVLAHHNAVAGRDEWRDIAALIVLGRCAPSPAAVEHIAEALTGAAVQRIPTPWYPKVPVQRELAGGGWMTAEADRHPDPICEAIRWQICEGELVQIIGRARGADRTAANPVDVLVLTDVPLPLLVRPVTLAELAPSLADRMLAECGFAFTTPRHAADACPALWPNWQAAKKDMQREALAGDQKGTNPNKESSIGICPPLPPNLGRVDYQRAGERQSPATAYFDLLTASDPRAALTALLGPLAWSRLEGEPEPERPAKAPRAAKPAPPPRADAPKARGSTHGPAAPAAPAADTSAKPAAAPPLAVVPSAPPGPPPATPKPRQAPLLLLFLPRPPAPPAAALPAPALVPPPAGIPPPTGPPG